MGWKIEWNASGTHADVASLSSKIWHLGWECPNEMELDDLLIHQPMNLLHNNDDNNNNNTFSQCGSHFCEPINLPFSA